VYPTPSIPSRADPKFAPKPITDAALLSGPLGPTNKFYAVTKITGIKMCRAYRIQHGLDAVSAVPTNLYGPHDQGLPYRSGEPNRRPSVTVYRPVSRGYRSLSNKFKFSNPRPVQSVWHRLTDRLGR
jgi:nucleoside-diphosphate-sugar epimerase